MISLVSQRWPGFNSPDSEFYASLSLFGSDVVDRAVEPSYYWTRLGYIAPVRLLVTVLGPWVGFEVWRVFLIALIITAVYTLVHVAGRPRGLGVVLALAVGLNTVILSFVGNTYLTGTLLAGIFLVLALAVSQLGSVASRGRGLFGSPRWTTGLLIGVVFGWLVMTNPYGLLLAAAMWGAVRVAVLVLLRDERWKRLLIDASMIGVGFLVSAGAFLLAGRVIFPGRDWLATYLAPTGVLSLVVRVDLPVGPRPLRRVRGWAPARHRLDRRGGGRPCVHHFRDCLSHAAMGMGGVGDFGRECRGDDRPDGAVHRPVARIAHLRRVAVAGCTLRVGLGIHLDGSWDARRSGSTTASVRGWCRLGRRALDCRGTV